MKLLHICKPKYRAYWRDNNGTPWWMDWTYSGPVWSKNAFIDGGVEFGEIPQEILEATEDWSLSVRGDAIICSKRNSKKYRTRGLLPGRCGRKRSLTCVVHGESGRLG